jgi:uncharacterized damage-inducible protein DinB
MTLRNISKPKKNEYPPYSAIYMELVKDDGLVLQHMKDNFINVKKFIYSLPEEMLYYRYAEGKWSIKEILVHIIDDERIFAYRALRYARFDKTKLHGFHHKEYVFYSHADERSLESIFEEYEAVRNATIFMFNSFPEQAFVRGGASADSVYNRTVKALAYHIAGHELWHIKIIKERYLNMKPEKQITTF